MPQKTTTHIQPFLKHGYNKSTISSEDSVCASKSTFCSYDLIAEEVQEGLLNQAIFKARCFTNLYPKKSLIFAKSG